MEGGTEEVSAAVNLGLTYTSTFKKRCVADQGTRKDSKINLSIFVACNSLVF